MHLYLTWQGSPFDPNPALRDELGDHRESKGKMSEANQGDLGFSFYAPSPPGEEDLSMGSSDSVQNTWSEPGSM